MWEGFVTPQYPNISLNFMKLCLQEVLGIAQFSHQPRRKINPI